MPRVYKRKPGSKKREQINKDILKRAVYDVFENKKSLRGTAKLYNISVMTLKRYVRKKEKTVTTGNISPTYEPDYTQSKIFTNKEELDLSVYLETASKLYHGLTPKAARELAFQFAHRNNKKIPQKWFKSETASYDWFHGFMRRHPNLSLRVPEATSLSRATSFNRYNVSKFFENLRSLYEKYNFEAKDVWNVDETGITTVHKPKKIIACKGIKQVSKVTSGERGELVTICSAINASGTHIPPFLIFPRKNWQNRMTRDAPPGTAGAPHPSGWMTATNFVLFLQHFQKHVRCSKENPCVIIFDNHESHISIDSVNFARENGIHLLTIPPHTSQKLQPLDRILFGTLKSYYNTACDDWMVAHPGVPLTIYDIAGCLGKAYPAAMTPRNITKSFKITGIYPFDSDIFTDDEFMSSYVTDRPEATVNDEQPEATESVQKNTVSEPLPDAADNNQDISSTDRLQSPLLLESFDNSSECTLSNDNISSCLTLAQQSFLVVNKMINLSSSDNGNNSAAAPTVHSSPSNMKVPLPFEITTPQCIFHNNTTHISKNKTRLQHSPLDLSFHPSTDDSTTFSQDAPLLHPSSLHSTVSPLSAIRPSDDSPVSTIRCLQDPLTLESGGISSVRSFGDSSPVTLNRSMTNVQTPNVISSIPSTSTYVALDVIKPFPKAGPRKSNSKGRKKGSTRIITDTPEKISLENKAREREEKNRKKSAKSVKRNFEDTSKKAKKKPRAKKQKIEKEDTSSEEEIILPPSPESDYNIEDEMQEQSEEEEACNELDDDNVHEDDWVVVNFVSERSVPHRFVGQVVNESLASLDIKFAKKINDKKFKWPENPDTSVIGKYQVVKKLPPPLFKSSSKRVGAFEFPKSLRQFKIEK